MLHADARNLTSPSGQMKSDIFLSQRNLLRTPFIRQCLDLTDCGLHLADLGGRARTPHRKGRTGNNTSHMLRHLVTIRNHFTGSFLDPKMVRVSLRTVDQDCIHGSVHGTLQIRTGEPRPIRRKLVAADSIGMALEVNHRYLALAVTDETDKLKLFVRLAERTLDAGIAHSRIRAHSAVLHAVAADEGDSLSLSTPHHHRCGCKIRQRIGGSFCATFRYLTVGRLDHWNILLMHLLPMAGIPFCGRNAGNRTCMGMSTGKKDRIKRNACLITHRFAYIHEHRIHQMDIVYRHDERFRRTIRNRHTPGIQRIQHTIRHTTAIIAGQRRTDLRGYVHLGIPHLEIHSSFRLCANHRQHGRHHQANCNLHSIKPFFSPLSFNADNYITSEPAHDPGIADSRKDLLKDVFEYQIHMI